MKLKLHNPMPCTVFLNVHLPCGNLEHSQANVLSSFLRVNGQRCCIEYVSVYTSPISQSNSLQTTDYSGANGPRDYTLKKMHSIGGTSAITEFVTKKTCD